MDPWWPMWGRQWLDLVEARGGGRSGFEWEWRGRGGEREGARRERLIRSGSGGGGHRDRG